MEYSSLIAVEYAAAQRVCSVKLEFKGGEAFQFDAGELPSLFTISGSGTRPVKHVKQIHHVVNCPSASELLFYPDKTYKGISPYSFADIRMFKVRWENDPTWRTAIAFIPQDGGYRSIVERADASFLGYGVCNRWTNGYRHELRKVTECTPKTKIHPPVKPLWVRAAYSTTSTCTDTPLNWDDEDD